MAAINGVKKSSVVKTKKGKVGVATVLTSVVIAILVTVLAFVAFWKFYYHEEVVNQVVEQMEQGTYQAYAAVRDIESGEYLSGAVELVSVPSTLVASDLIGAGADISNLKASGKITANSIISERNAYDPDMQNPVLERTRIYMVDYIKTPGVNVGDFIDIRVKVYEKGNEASLKDQTVCSKVEILSKDEVTGAIQIRLSEADILNLNSAVIEAASGNSTNNLQGDIYVGTYPEPATQPKATVNYDGKGIVYTQDELKEAQDKIRNQSNTDGETTDVPSDTAEHNDNADAEAEADVQDVDVPVSGTPNLDSQVPAGESVGEE